MQGVYLAVSAAHPLHINLPTWFYFYSLWRAKSCCAFQLFKQQKQTRRISL